MSKRILTGIGCLAAGLLLVGCTTPHQNPPNAANLSQGPYTTGEGNYANTPHRYPFVDFSFDSAEIHTSWYPELNTVATALKSHTQSKAIVMGNTDSVGNPAYNKKLGLRRANAVADYLVSQGVRRDQLVVRTRGEKHPLAENSGPVNKHLNRRVTIIIKPNMMH